MRDERLLVNRRDRRVDWWHKHPRLLRATVHSPLAVLGGLGGWGFLRSWPASSFNELLLPLLVVSIALLMVTDTLTAWQTRELSLAGMSTSRRLEGVGSDLKRMRRTLEGAVEEVERLQQLADELEVEAEDHLALSRMTSEQFDAFRRDQVRRDRRDRVRDVVMFGLGVAVTVVTAVVL